MKYVFKGLRRSVFDSEPLRLTLSRQLDLPEIDSVYVEREALDARRKPNVVYVYNLRFTVSGKTPRLQTLLSRGTIADYSPRVLPEPDPRIELPERPIIVGFGPAGMFLGLYLARKGYKPIIYERGQKVEARARSVDRLWREGILDAESNLQFGEGGAGTFSDGKLTTGKSSPLDRLILETFVEAGAPETILFSYRPHVGTDNLRRVVTYFRERVVALGGEIHFGHKVTDLHLENSAIGAISVSGQRVSTRCVILAIGHSARDTMHMLHCRGVRMVPKPFAIGTRIEHSARFINETQYGDKAAKVLLAADYKLAHRHSGVGVYSFCMCPGGRVVCASSEPKGLVTNGMSRYARDSARSNSALVVGVTPGALGLDSPLDAIRFQRHLEQKAYEAGGGGFVSPAQSAADFCRGELTRSLDSGGATYQPGIVPGRLDVLLPTFVTGALRAGLRSFGRKMPGFIAKGLLIGVETRTSSPIRILRDEDCCSVSTPGLYLLGEGSGYAGGIMTCARDALRFARLVKPRV